MSIGPITRSSVQTVISGMSVALQQPVSLGTGDGATLTFDLPMDETIQCSVFVGTVVQPASAWSISAGTGPGGVDQLVFGAGNAPANGMAVEAIVWAAS